MNKIVLASKNPVKRRAVENGFCRIFPEQEFSIETISVPSGVSDQPSTDAETLLGACNRAECATREIPQADYWVGVEGGISMHESDMEAYAWIVIRSRSQIGKARTGAFYLPPEVAQLVRQGHELGVADDLVFGRSNSKQDNGAVGLLTHNIIDRAMFYEQAVILALIPFINPHLYPGLEE